MHRLRRFVAPLFRQTPNFRGKGRLVLLFDRLAIRPEIPETFLVSGVVNRCGSMHFDLRAWGQKFAYYYGEWEADLIAICRNLYNGGDFVDIGSSLGLYIVCMGDLIKKCGGTIFSVEPLTFNLNRQRANLEMNGLLSQVVFVQAALGAEAGSVLISFDPDQIDNNAIVGQSGVPIPVRRLDEVLQDSNSHIGFVKIDVEGYEPEVLAGGWDVIHNHRPFILAEFNRARMKINGTNMIEAVRKFRHLSYRMFRSEGRKLIELGEPGDFENLFFIPSERSLPRSLLRT